MDNTFKTILEDDMEKLLASLDLKILFDAGGLSCSHCKKKLRKEDIFGIYPLSGDIKVSCNSAECIQKTVEQTEKLNSLLV